MNRKTMLAFSTITPKHFKQISLALTTKIQSVPLARLVDRVDFIMAVALSMLRLHQPGLMVLG